MTKEKKPPPLQMDDHAGEITPPEAVPAMQWRIPPSKESKPEGVERALHERIKELNCLYAITQLVESESTSIDDVLTAVVNILPPSWQYPEITCARIIFQKKTFKSRGFKVSKWRQSSQILMHNEPVGEVTIFYLEERPPEHEGPFLFEERALLDAVAERIGKIAMHLDAERELQETNQLLIVERRALQEANTALKTIMGRIEDEKKEIFKQIRDNVEKVLLPILNELTWAVSGPKKKYVELLKDNLEDITAPFISQISQKYRSLTPTEIQICNLIRSGLRTKEIAEMRNISPATISRHRERIRRKLGIAGKDVNLVTHLQMIS
ncbi:MAG: LuxR C-terminal-related transcriptional regulator [Deltaproteobacteria bacterium]|nr:LuxR C-terminal-related transcriptional regulator [Deltaproteobacteria bacterium]